MVKYDIDYERDGYIVMKNPTTVDKYIELTNRAIKFDSESVGIFYAFSDAQFKEGYNSLVERGIIKGGEKILRGPGGSFGTRAAFDAMSQFFDECDAKIKAECDPQEVYFYEYNNHECMISWDGDYNAIGLIIRVFGMDTAKKIKRFNAYASLEDVASGKRID